jgi:basic amino acid/polyamine antiporter, APA family
MSNSANTTVESTPETKTLRRDLGVFDAVMLVMGGIVGAGIFVNPSEVAHRVHTPGAILSVWILGGVVALCGAFIWAELATRVPGTGGQYLYLREAYGRPVAFVYGWGLLLITQTGGMAAVAITFAVYFRSLTGSAINESLLAGLVLLGLSAINCFGARAGSSLQSGFMILKILAIATIVVTAMMFHPAAAAAPVLLSRPYSLGDFGAAFVPVAFAYGGWQTATFVSGEMANPRRDLSRGLIIGVLGVVILYLAVNVACLHVLGTTGLDKTSTPASELMRKVIGESGARLVAAAVAISTLGFLSQSMLTAPRVYYAMARDGTFFKGVGALFGKANAPVVAIALQGVAAAIIASSGKYGEILNFEVTIDFIFFALTAASLFLFRRRQTGPDKGLRTALGHPVSTIVFICASLAVVASAVASTPKISLIACLIMFAGIPVYMIWASVRCSSL